MKDMLKNKKIIYIIIALFILLFTGIVLSKHYESRVIVRKILKIKYDNVMCIDSECNGILAEEKGKKKTSVKLFNSDGNLIGKYDYNNFDKKIKKPFYLSKNYLLMSKKISDKKTEFSINTTNAKELYKTKNNLSKVNDYVILESAQAKVDYSYTLLDLYGKVLMSDITDFESYGDGKIMYGNHNTHSYIFNKKGKVLLDGYKVSEIFDDYLILKSAKKDVYYYFNISKSKIINEGFYSYRIKNDVLEVTRKENQKDVVYSIDKYGKEEFLKDSKSLSDVITSIQKQIIDDNYILYSISVIDSKTKKVFVDNKNNNSFGIYDLSKKSYKELYSYKITGAYTDINILNQKDNKYYFQISCSKPMCEENIMYVYDYNKQKIEFSLEGSSRLASKYTQYENGYKVVRFSSRSEDEKYKGKYVIFNDKNEEVDITDEAVIIVDSNEIFGAEYEKVLLYKSKSNKFLNTSKNLATLEDKKYYKFGTTLVDKKGKEIYKISSNSSLEYSKDYVYAIGTNDVKIYSIDNNKVYSYKLEKNESILSKDNKKMIPYKSLVLINNEKNEVSKLINVRMNKVKKLKNTTIFSINKNKDGSREYLVTTQKVKGKIKYGLYILD